jgi:hypothetical protein
MNVEASLGGPRLDYIFEGFIAPVHLPAAALARRLEAEGKMRPVPTGTLFFLIAHGATAPAAHRPLAGSSASQIPPTLARCVSTPALLPSSSSSPEPKTHDERSARGHSVRLDKPAVELLLEIKFTTSAWRSRSRP